MAQPRGPIRQGIARLLRRALRALARLAEIEPHALRQHASSDGSATASTAPPSPPARRRYAEEFLRDVPAWLDVVKPPASPEELEAGAAIRRPFVFAGNDAGPPYMVDMIRAFRLVAGASLYIEVGTFDKGNLAYLSRQLADDATLIDIDIEARPEQSALLSKTVGARQTVETVVGDSSDDRTLAQVRGILKGRLADAVFIDANHCADYAFADYAAYAPLVRPGGWVLFHDVYWAGDDTTFGSAMAVEQIDRLTPVHVVFGNDPVHRFLPWLGKQDTIWGGVGIVRR